MIIDRTKSYTDKMHQQKLSFVRQMAQELVEMGYYIPGAANTNRSFWLFPVMVPNSRQFVDFMVKQGFNVFQGSTQMTWVPMPDHLKGKLGDAKVLRDYFQKHVAYMPIKAPLTAEQQHMTKTQFSNACQRYMDYMNELKKKRMTPEGSVEDASNIAPCTETLTTQPAGQEGAAVMKTAKL